MPLDRRVWLECQALVSRGYDVSVICPKGPNDKSRATLDGVDIYKYRPPPAAHGLAGFIIEFGYAWVRTALLSMVVWRHKPFHMMQACNPPDTYWALARLWRGHSVRFVFDHHDLNPELFRSRFGEPKGLSQRLQYMGLLWLERMTFRTADRVVSTNESYKEVAIRRGHVDSSDVTVVRSCPDTRTMRPVYSPAMASKSHRFALVYLGIMGPQDDVDLVLEVMDELVNKRGRHDVHAWLLGFGDCYEDLRRQCAQLGLDHVVTFTGRADKAVIADRLSAADVGLCPDLKTPLNDVSTMNKTMEYMAYCLPSVSFDLAETRVSGGDAVIYVRSGDMKGFADAVERLLDDAELRLDLAHKARERVSKELDWAAQAKKYVDVFDDLVGRGPSQLRTHAVADVTEGEANAQGWRYVNLDDEREMSRFILGRSATAPWHDDEQLTNEPVVIPRVG